MVEYEKGESETYNICFPFDVKKEITFGLGFGLPDDMN